MGYKISNVDNQTTNIQSANDMMLYNMRDFIYIHKAVKSFVYGLIMFQLKEPKKKTNLK